MQPRSQGEGRREIVIFMDVVLEFVSLAFPRMIRNAETPIND